MEMKSTEAGFSAPAATENDYAYWKDMVSNLVMTGYDHVLSIEHEDSLMTV